jgi:hypothetical protein
MPLHMLESSSYDAPRFLLRSLRSIPEVPGRERDSHDENAMLHVRIWGSIFRPGGAEIAVYWPADLGPLHVDAGADKPGLSAEVISNGFEFCLGSESGDPTEIPGAWAPASANASAPWDAWAPGNASSGAWAPASANTSAPWDDWAFSNGSSDAWASINGSSNGEYSAGCWFHFEKAQVLKPFQAPVRQEPASEVPAMPMWPGVCPNCASTTCGQAGMSMSHAKSTQER